MDTTLVILIILLLFTFTILILLVTDRCKANNAPSNIDNQYSVLSAPRSNSRSTKKEEVKSSEIQIVTMDMVDATPEPSTVQESPSVAPRTVTGQTTAHTQQVDKLQDRVKWLENELALAKKDSDLVNSRSMASSRRLSMSHQSVAMQLQAARGFPLSSSFSLPQDDSGELVTPDPHVLELQGLLKRRSAQHRQELEHRDAELAVLRGQLTELRAN
eukprot:gnl/Dysnectes_brevis/2755_a3353_1580.p1 GENE.gnl/Dysnectes_brevis/2755_a3353_1580~~gnl/Dysnectes_brevis/2755_a3353_1580.p1  ORF type:complete len:216 (-),score=34.99 gnl/Dysnectes_brevis/2755_a3353_1580:133-780(-)